MRAHNIVCFHTMVGSLSGTRAMFERNGYGGTESHYGVGERGEGDQWQDLAYTADANLDGNDDVISIESADYGGVFGKWNTSDGNAVPGFSLAQIDRLIDLGYALALPGRVGYGSLHRLCPKDWDCYKSGIPAALIPDTRPGRRGFGYHAQGVAGQGLVRGGVKWSSAYGKVCPGSRRIKQIKGIIIPAIAERIAGQQNQEEDPMAGITAQEIADAIMKAPVGGSADDSAGTFGQGQYRLQSEVMRLADQVANLAELQYGIAKGDGHAIDTAIARVRARDLQHPGEPK
jgi:hypothetical protein